MKFKILITLIFIFFLSVQAFSDVSIYLFPKVKFSEEIKLSDIGKIEYKFESIDPGELIIDPSMFSDGLIDRKELRSLLMNHFSSIYIFGTGTRILFEDSNKSQEQIIIGDGSISSGADIKIILKNKNIRVLTDGTAMGNGKIGEIIPVKLKNSKVVKGIIIKNKTVEIAL